MVFGAILAVVAAFGISVLSLLVVGVITDTTFPLWSVVLMTILVAVILEVVVF